MHHVEQMSVPAGGSVRGSTVKFSGDPWVGCTGNVDGASIHGTCPDGCTFDMAPGGGAPEG